MTLPPRQREVLDLIRQIHAVTTRGAPRILVARRLRLDPKTVQGHADRLYRKGLLASPCAPFIPQAEPRGPQAEGPLK